MRLATAPAWLLTVLLAVGGFAQADSGNETQDSDSQADSHAGPDCAREPTPREQEACKAKQCRKSPEDSRCPKNGKSPPEARERAEGGKDREDDAAEKPRGEPRHLRFTVHAEGQIGNLTVGGRLALESLVLDAEAPLRSERTGNAFVMGNAGMRLRLHDNPVGMIEFKGTSGQVQLAFPADAQATMGEKGHAARIHYADGRMGLLVAENATWDGNAVALRDFFTFHVTRGDGPFEKEKPGASGPPRRALIEAAMQKRHVGAEIALAHRPPLADGAVQVMTYDDMTVNVTLPPANATGYPIAVRLSSELDEGRTVAIQVDPALLDNATPERLVLRYFDDHDDGTQTEVVFVQAASLVDVLDPTDDAGQPEYWVVQDPDGLQVLVSVPHWSVHTVTLASLDAILQPSVLGGLVVGLTGTLLAGVALFWPRRLTP